jgi:hypothetical protein
MAAERCPGVDPGLAVAVIGLNGAGLPIAPLLVLPLLFLA